MSEEVKKSGLKSALKQKQPGELKMKKNVSLQLDTTEAIEESNSGQAAAGAPESAIKVPEVSQQTKNKKKNLNIQIEADKDDQAQKEGQSQAQQAPNQGKKQQQKQK